MEFNPIQIIVIIVIIFRVFNSIFKSSKGSKGKSSKPKSNPFEDFQKQLKKFEESFDETKSEPEQPKNKPLTFKTRKKPAKRYPVEAQSLEITKAPYSNLEKGIIDDVHRDKFEHHDITKNEIGDVDNTKKLQNVLKDFEPKKAFIHSLIFERKHFDV